MTTEAGPQDHTEHVPPPPQPPLSTDSASGPIVDPEVGADGAEEHLLDGYLPL